MVKSSDRNKPSFSNYLLSDQEHSSQDLCILDMVKYRNYYKFVVITSHSNGATTPVVSITCTVLTLPRSHFHIHILLLLQQMRADRSTRQSIRVALFTARRPRKRGSPINSGAFASTGSAVKTGLTSGSGGLS